MLTFDSFYPLPLQNSTGGEPGFMTLHERVGRVGSQRLTVFNG
jgi:hypothetical protein